MAATTSSARPSDTLSRNQRLELYYYARLTRDVEERVQTLHRQGKITGAVYRSLGQEGESVATAYALNRGDALSPLTRNLGALLAMGVRPLVMFLQYMAKGSSAARGRDLSNHFANIPQREERAPILIGPVSPLGDMVAVMGGVALAAKMRRRPLVAMVYVGDGATSTGVFHEAMNFAAVNHLPLVVIAQDNKFAYSTPVRQQWRSSASISGPKRTGCVTSWSTATTCWSSTTRRKARSTTRAAAAGRCCSAWIRCG